MAVLEMSLHVNIVKIYPSENKYSVYLKQCSVPIPICANNTDYKRMEKCTLCFRKVDSSRYTAVQGVFLSQD